VVSRFLGQIPLTACCTDHAIRLHKFLCNLASLVRRCFADALLNSRGDGAETEEEAGQDGDAWRPDSPLPDREGSDSGRARREDRRAAADDHLLRGARSSPPPELLVAIADALDVSTDILLGRKKVPERSGGAAPATSVQRQKHLKRLDELPPHDQKAVFKIIDALAERRAKSRGA